MKKKLLISLPIGILISALGLYLAFRNIPMNELLAYFKTIRYIWMVPTVLLVAVAFLLRVLRWQVILNTSEKITFMQAFHPLLIGFMVNNILPGRVGEVARPLILTGRNKVPFFTAVASVAAERLFDGMFLILFLAVALGTVPMDDAAKISFGKYTLDRETLTLLGVNFMILCIILLGGICLIVFDPTRKWIQSTFLRFSDQVLGFFSPAFREKIRTRLVFPMIRMLDHAAQGASLIKKPRKMIACLLISLAIWLISALSYQVMSFGCPGVTISFFQSIIVMVMVCFFISIPSVPGFWGLWEAGGVFALSLFSVSPGSAAGFTLVNHVAQIIPSMVLGFTSAAVVSINILKIGALSQEAK